MDEDLAMLGVFLGSMGLLDDEAEDSWREEHFSDFIDYGLDPDDYDTEEDYLEALDEAREEDPEDL